MAMALTDYVSSYAEIRALLGVSDEELEDATLALRVWSRSLEEGLNEVDLSVGKTSGALIAEFHEVAQVANASRTAAQQRFFDNVQVYASYHVALDLAGSLPQFSPKTITDGKAMVQRHADSPYKMVVDAITAGKARALTRLTRAYGAQIGETLSDTTAAPPSYFEVSTPDNNPVTG